MYNLAPKKLRQMREQHIPRFSRGALAEKVGVSENTIKRWETGKTEKIKDCNVEVIYKIADELQCDIEDITETYAYEPMTTPFISSVPDGIDGALLSVIDKLSDFRIRIERRDGTKELITVSQIGSLETFALGLPACIFTPADRKQPIRGKIIGYEINGTLIDIDDLLMLTWGIYNHIRCDMENIQGFLFQLQMYRVSCASEAENKKTHYRRGLSENRFDMKLARDRLHNDSYKH